eukprot:m.30713 g.30713  ORF g.30713 m.30713 type:complete len:368 (+) comp14623_c0_seq1:56-1159(+)
MIIVYILMSIILFTLSVKISCFYFNHYVLFVAVACLLPRHHRHRPSSLMPNAPVMHSPPLRKRQLPPLRNVTGLPRNTCLPPLARLTPTSPPTISVHLDTNLGESHTEQQREEVQEQEDRGNRHFLVGRRALDSLGSKKTLASNHSSSSSLSFSSLHSSPLSSCTSSPSCSPCPSPHSHQYLSDSISSHNSNENVGQSSSIASSKKKQQLLRLFEKGESERRQALQSLGRSPVSGFRLLQQQRRSKEGQEASSSTSNSNNKPRTCSLLGSSLQTHMFANYHRSMSLSVPSSSATSEDNVSLPPRRKLAKNFSQSLACLPPINEDEEPEPIKSSRSSRTQPIVRRHRRSLSDPIMFIPSLRPIPETKR